MTLKTKPKGYHPSYKGARLVQVADIQFDDGDTFDYKNKPIRVLGIDTITGRPSVYSTSSGNRRLEFR